MRRHENPIAVWRGGVDGAREMRAGVSGRWPVPPVVAHAKPSVSGLDTQCIPTAEGRAP